MEKNGRIKKIGCLGAYSFVLFLFAFDCLYFWVSQKRQVVHYNKLTECFYGKHVTYLSGVYLWAYIFFILMPVVFFIFWKKRTFRHILPFRNPKKGRNFFQPAEKLVNELTKTISSVTMPVQIKEGGYTS